MDVESVFLGLVGSVAWHAPGQFLETAAAASRAGRASSIATNHSDCSPMYLRVCGDQYLRVQ